MALPDLIVGIDLGYTCTGVAYFFPKHFKDNANVLNEPDIIQTWPGISETIVDKVPTAVGFEEGRKIWGNMIPTEWFGRRAPYGASCAQQFKLLLSKEMLESTNRYMEGQAPYRMEDVEKMFENFLSQLYEWITPKFAQMLGRETLEGASVEFLFSVPTTWDRTTVRRYREVIKRAGYGKEETHKVNIGVNEAKAAAVHTALYPSTHQSQQYNDGDILLVCDAGGGTTDVSILKVAAVKNNIAQCTQLYPVEGAPIGSVKIDEGFHQLVKRQARRDVGAKALENFQPIKHGLGEKDYEFFDYFSIDVNDSGSEEVFKLSRVDLERLFDDQIKVICELLDYQLQALKDKSARPNRLILSGGLGSSKYVQQRLQAHYGKEFGMNILIAQKPQLVVCRGLVMHRVMNLFKVDIIPKHCCPASYGVVFDELYDKNIHSHIKHLRRKSKCDGRYYIPDRIRWFLDKDELLDSEMSEHDQRFVRSVNGEMPGKSSNDIVKFDGDLIDRPNHLQSADMTTICTVRYELDPMLLRSSIPGVIRRRGGFRLGFRKYAEVEYTLHIEVWETGLTVSISLGDGRKSKGQDIEVGWSTWRTEIRASPMTARASEDDRWEPEDSFENDLETVLLSQGS